MSSLGKCWRSIPTMLSFAGAFRRFRRLTSPSTYAVLKYRKARRISRGLQAKLKTSKDEELDKRRDEVLLRMVIQKVKFIVNVGKLMDSVKGIIGTTPSTYGDFMHADMDIDLTTSEEPRAPVEEPEYGSIAKPEDIFHVIDHFCLGKPLLHVSGRVNLLHGWPRLSIGPGMTNSDSNCDTYNSYFNKNQEDYLPERIEAPLPKSSPTKSKRNGPGGRGRNSRGGGNRPRIGNRGRGAHRGRQ